MTRDKGPRALGPGDMREVRRMTEEGLSAARIASELGCSASTVSRCRSQLGISPARRQSGWWRWDSDQVRRLRELARHATSWVQVADELGISCSTVKGKARRLGIHLGGLEVAPGRAAPPTARAEGLDRWQRRRLVEAAWRCWQAGVTDMRHVAGLGASLAGCTEECARNALPMALADWRAGRLGRSAA